MVASRSVASAFTSEQQRRGVTFFGEEERRSEHSGEERSRKRYAVSDDEVCVPYKREGTTPDRPIPKKFAATVVCKNEISLTA